MTAADLLEHLRELGVHLWAEGDRLHVSAQRGSLTPELRTDLERRKPELLAALRARRAREETVRAPIPRGPVTGRHPVSFAQERLWFLEQLGPGGSAYNIHTALRLAGPLDEEALRRSLQAVVDRHAALRTTIAVVDGQPVQVVAPALELPVPVVDLRGLWGPEREARAKHVAAEEVQRPLALAGGALVRARLVRLEEQAHILLLTFHHAVADGWSVGVLMRELAALYEGLVAGATPQLAPLPIQYADFARWQREWLQGEVLEEELAYWRRCLSGSLPTLEFPADRPRPAVQSLRGSSHAFTLPARLVDPLRRLAREARGTLFMALLAAFKCLLCRYTGQEDLLIGCPVAGRTRPETEGLIGFFVNTLVLRTDLSGEPTFRELLRRVRETTLGAFGHQELPFERVVEAQHPDRDPSRTPLFQVFFNMVPLEEAPVIRLPACGLSLELLPPPEDVQAKFDLTLYAAEERDGLQVRLTYNADLFTPARMAEVLRQFQQLLEQIVADPDRRLADFSLVTPIARAALPDPTTPLEASWHGAVHEAFARHARQVPERVALLPDGDAPWSYGELEARSNRLAHYLRAHGVGLESVVAIYAYRSASLAWAVLGVLKAGAAFLLLDPAYPEARLLAYLRQAQPRAWLEVAGAGTPPPDLAAIAAAIPCRARLGPGPAAKPVLDGYAPDNPAVPVGPDSLACLTFTSGSTGEPRGVLGRHGALTAFLPWQAATFDLGPSDRVSCLSGLAHDPLQRDLFTPFWVGGALCFPDPTHWGTPGYLARWLLAAEVTVANLTPAMVDFLTAGPAPALLPALRYAFLVGEALTWRTVTRLRAVAPRVTAVNLYGTTETQRALAHYVVPPHDGAPGKAVVPLGHSLPGMQLLVVTPTGQLAGIGEPGELVVRSPHLARGYLGDVALTQARFGANPITRDQADRVYRTGDRGRYNPDGTVEFLGRSDTQVSLRGFRIELQEIEATLGQHVAVRQAVVMVRADPPGDPRLVAYVVPGWGGPPAVAELRRHLQAQVPDYMVPAAFVFLEAFPLTPNGKVDRKALPAPDLGAIRKDLQRVSPRTPVEERLAAIWKDLLEIAEVGVHDDFFGLGGHSLLAMRVLARVEEAYRVQLPLRNLFEAPTVAGLAEAIGEALVAEADEDELARLLDHIQVASGDRWQPSVDTPER